VAQLTAMSSSQNETIVQNLLNMMCDAVVLLDEHLKVKSAAPKLTALLLRRPKPDDLCGTSFPNLLKTSDQDRFRECALEGNANGQSIHVDMLDSGGSRLNLQLFHCRFKNVLSETCHMVGVREELDSAMKREPPAEHGPALAEIHPLTLSGASSTSSACSEEFVPIRCCDEEPIAVWVDIFSEDLRILSCTSGFTSIGGPIHEGEGFLEWIKGDKGTVLKWVQHMVNLHESEDVAINPYPIKLTPPHQHVIEFACTCKFHVEEMDGENDDVTAERVGCFEFSSVQSRQRTKRISRRTHVGTSSVTAT